MTLLFLILSILLVSCSSFRLSPQGFCNSLRPHQLHKQVPDSRLQSPASSNVVISRTRLAALSLEETTSSNAFSNSVMVSFVRDLYNQYGLLSLALPAAIAGAAWTYYVRKVLKNKPTIYECEKCGNQLRAPAGKSRLVLDRPGFKCPRCHSNGDSYFDINGWDFRAAKRRARVQAEEAARNKYVDMKEEKVKAAAEYAAMRAAAAARAREVEEVGQQAGARRDEAEAGGELTSASGSIGGISSGRSSSDSDGQES